MDSLRERLEIHWDPATDIGLRERKEKKLTTKGKCENSWCKK